MLRLGTYTVGIDGVIQDGREAQQDMIWQGRAHENVNCLAQGKRGRNAGTKGGNASETRNIR
jgi:hypothetical protein